MTDVTWGHVFCICKDADLILHMSDYCVCFPFFSSFGLNFTLNSHVNFNPKLEISHGLGFRVFELGSGRLTP
jgi:hypothetical protein